jgi:hypothetical protein
VSRPAPPETTSPTVNAKLVTLHAHHATADPVRIAQHAPRTSSSSTRNHALHPALMDTSRVIPAAPSVTSLALPAPTPKPANHALVSCLLRVLNASRPAMMGTTTTTVYAPPAQLDARPALALLSAPHAISPSCSTTRTNATQDALLVSTSLAEPARAATLPVLLVHPHHHALPASTANLRLLIANALLHALPRPSQATTRNASLAIKLAESVLVATLKIVSLALLDSSSLRVTA